MMQSSHGQQNTGDVLVSCTRSVALGLCGLALLAGFVLAAPFIADAIAFIWYGWARLLTSNYTTVLPAALLEWSALIIAVWAICVTVKLERAKPDAGLLFALVAALLLVFAVLPANCALFAVMTDWAIPFSKGHTAMEIAASATVLLVLMTCAVSPLLALVACIVAS
ncbi:hypothetical protein VI03_25070 [Burkholderia vietnamiensis]|uniref:hypothetical protein n=1 Tax=Burkholderia vietnamiensis TaxID=60552 RepID=UPI0006215573|nr:hypothetical protein [Burkholderia vietnamiensis]KKI36054.1 hypothetical protein VI03_25070 [Burkholderia vietnamiensis]MBR8189189.1 hypothetical protein [Burkholderia vietnamiensis]HDR9174396.1 hypothetical protein [Burkholderia vietnamiensis]